MLTPSCSELMDIIKLGEKLDNRAITRYTVVLAAAKRARQITDGAKPLTYAPTDRAVSIAVQEIRENKLRIKVQDSLLDTGYERVVKNRCRYRTALSKDDLREDLKQDYAPLANYDIDAGDALFRNDPFVPEVKLTELIVKEEDDPVFEEEAEVGE